MKEKSIKINAIINIVKVAMSIIFPIITFPYASRVLGADNIGKVQFASSVVAYLSLMAALGINTYATREGAIIRNDKEKIQKFANQIFTINVITTSITYGILLILLILPTKLLDYRLLIMVQSLSVLFSTIGVEWIYNIYEDYAYITKKSILTQIISMILLFLFVKESNDYYIYALISVFATGSVNIFNFIHARKYCKFKLVRKTDIKKHFKPMMVLFSNDLAVNIYVNSDVILLGIFTNDFTMGLYTVTAKVYDIVKRMINSITNVTLPRMSLYANTDKEKYNYLLEKLFKSIISLVIPAIVGLIILSKQVILLIAGTEYVEATLSLVILSVALGFATLANILVNGILIPNKKEKCVFYATIIAAILNIGLNFIAIPLWKQNGAALTTVIAELTVCIVSIFYSRKLCNFKNLKRTVIVSFISCIAIFAVSEVIKIFVANIILQTALIVIGGVGAYAIVSLLLKNDIAVELFNNIINKTKSIIKR